MGYLPYLGIAYLLTMNIFGAAIAASDKRRAKRREWRTPEKTFLLLALLGGGIGVLAGFFAFRHKTKHIGLVLGVAAITSGLIAVICLLFAYL